ncbi:MAG: polysaccharide deacetylase family protein [Novosphingobium sp.]
MITPRPPRRLLASIHDVGPRFAGQVDRLADRLESLLGSKRFAMLVVPDHWDQAPLAQDSAYQAKLRQWSDQGVEMFVHGWRHRDDGLHRGALARWKATRMTAGEGEFLGLDHDEALARMLRARDVVEQAIGRPAAGFVAPAWLYGEGAHSALREAGFALAEDHMRVWEPVSGRNLAKGPVITWASRSRGRITSSLMFAGLARRTLGVLDTVRIAVHPGDTSVPSLLDSIDRTFSRFARSHTPSTYASLVSGSGSLESRSPR